MTFTSTMTGRYGESFTDLGEYEAPHWQEFMHYLYLPVRIPERDVTSLPQEVTTPEGLWARIPARLWFLRQAVHDAMQDARETTSHLHDPYVYVTARRGFATPGNPLNRPGWHCDDFGGTDLNYVWTDRYPTRFLTSALPLPIEDDDVTSMSTMEHFANLAYYAQSIRALAEAQGRSDGQPSEADDLNIVIGPPSHLLRLTPWVIHSTPEIPAPGGMRSFFKISVSTHRYDLVGNSHNYLLDYDWPMVSRQELRNKPSGGNSDYSQ